MKFSLEYRQNKNGKFHAWIEADIFETRADALTAAQSLHGREGRDWQIVEIGGYDHFAETETERNFGA